MVTWVQQSSGSYEISSAEHLKQLMNQGSLYIDSGTPPSSYWGESGNIVKYIQTADIDLLSDSTHIKPIGTNSANFYGNYDGGNYSISNYSYVDPNFNTSDSCEPDVGLFGRCNRVQIMRNIRLDGVWTIQGFENNAGFIAGYINVGGTFSGFEANFSPGTYLATNSSTKTNYGNVGSLFGGLFKVYRLSTITVRGTIDYQDLSSKYTIGGIIGYVRIEDFISSIRNLASFPSGIRGSTTGGIIGSLSEHGWARNRVMYMLNALTGDICGSSHAGGIVGRNQGSGRVRYLSFVNAMQGDIYGTADYANVGGIAGYCKFLDSSPCEKLYNYMTGNIYRSEGVRYSYIGGLCGRVFRIWRPNGWEGYLRNNINAMNGHVSGDALFAFVEDGPIDSYDNIANTDFGLTFAGNRNSIGTPTGLLHHPDFPDLPYFDMGNFEFVYGNVSGNSLYSDYTHLIVHKRDIYTPYEVSYGLDETNTSVYLTYVDTQIMKVYPPDELTGFTSVAGVTIAGPPLKVNVRSINALVTVGDVVEGYRLTYEGPDGIEKNVETGAHQSVYNIVSLEPQTLYIFRLYEGSDVVESVSKTTLEDEASNYVASDFFDGKKYQLRNLSKSSRVKMSRKMNSVFNTGNILTLLHRNQRGISAKFVKRGETVVSDGDNLLAPFVETDGPGQSFNLEIEEGNSTVVVGYNEASNTVVIGTNEYSVGDNLVLDNKKCTVVEYIE